MPTIRVRGGTSPKFLPLIFAVISFLIGGILIGLYLNYQSKGRNYIEVTATIEKIENVNQSPTTYVGYVIDSNEYHNIQLDVYTSDFKVGQNIPVKVNPNNHYEAIYADNKFYYATRNISFVLFAAGIMLAGLGTISLVEKRL